MKASLDNTQAQPQISLLLAVHNKDAYLPETLASLAAQTIGVENLEIVLIDDASTDATSEQIDTFAGKYPGVKTKHVSFRNVGKVRNATLAMATSPYLMFVDGDDVLPLNACELLLKAAQEKTADMIVTPLRRFYGTAPQSPVKKVAFSSREATALWEELLRHQRYMGHLLGCLFSRRLFATLRFPEMSCYEDVFIVPDLLAQSPRILVSDTPVYFYRQHEHSLSAALNDAKATHMLSMLAKLQRSVKGVYQQRLFEALCVKQCRVVLDNARNLSRDNRRCIGSLMEAIPSAAFLLSPHVRVSRKRIFLHGKWHRWQ